MKKKIVIIASVIIFVFAVGTVYAYFVDKAQAINEISIGSVDTEITEEFTPEEPIPGKSIEKIVKVKNIGKSPCYTRLKINFSDSDMEAVCTLSYEGTGYINTEDWAYNNSDGYYYYREALEPNETTSPIFTSVEIGGTEEDMKGFEISIYQESYQKGNFENYQEAWEYFTRNKEAS